MKHGKLLRNSLIVLGALFLATLAVFSTKNPLYQGELSSVSPVQTASPKEYMLLRDKYIQLAKSKDPKDVLEVLKKEADTNQAALYYCHDLMHDIGKISLQRLQDFSKAASYQDESCVSGYIHGVLQEYFSTTDDVFVAMQTACSDHKKENYAFWECYHGIGHGLMYFSDNDLPSSIKRCSMYHSAFAKNACANGVYMENFTADEGVHPTKYRKASDPFYPCASQAQEFKGGCYLNAPIYYLSLTNSDYKNAFSWCREAEGNFRLYCYSGLGAQAARRNIQKPKYVEAICMEGTREQREWCVVGLIDYYTGHFGDIKKSKALCDILDIRNKQVCSERVSFRENYL